MYNDIINTPLEFDNAPLTDEMKKLIGGMLTVNPSERLKWPEFYRDPLIQT
jgi:hypothetical protein